MDCKGKGYIVFEESCVAWDGRRGIQWKQNTRIGVFRRCQRLMENGLDVPDTVRIKRFLSAYLKIRGMTR